VKTRMLTIVPLVITLFILDRVISASDMQLKDASAASSASSTCSIGYQVNQWTGGFTANIQINNTGPALNGWVLTWTFTGNQQITSAWNTQLTQSGVAMSAHDAGYNAAIPAGGSTQLGFQATFSGSNAIPTNFAVNGLPCGGNPTATPDPTTAPTSTITPTPTVGITPIVTPAPTITPTQTITPTPASSCLGILFCDTFENQTGTIPSGVWQVSYPNCQGTGTVSIDRTIAHSGTTSIRVDGHAGYCNHVFFGTQYAFAGVGTDIYVRFFVRHTTALPIGHVTFVAMRDANDGGNDLIVNPFGSAVQAHGALESPASRTYACYAEDPQNPTNPACEAAIAAGGTQPLYDWFGVLNSNAGGQTVGYIPDGKLCSGNNPKYAAYDTPRTDWPTTNLAPGSSFTFTFGAWVPHPGYFRFYVTNSTYDPTKPLTWANMQSQPFLTVNPEPAVTNGVYSMTGTLPSNVSGKAIIYAVWTRTDSQETFYGCSDVYFSANGVFPTPTPPPTPTCTAVATITSSWQGGYQGSVSVTNTSSETVVPWVVSWTLPSGVTLVNGWNATVTQDSTTI
jgi:predicted carbohydrate-binding protein with CBM5 and CBM33 domain